MMTTIYLGDGLVSHEGPRFSHLSKQAREAAYFEQFRPENLREVRTVPLLTMLAAALTGFLALGALFSDDATQALSPSSREAANPPSTKPPSVHQRFLEESGTRLLRNGHENL